MMKFLSRADMAQKHFCLYQNDQALGWPMRWFEASFGIVVEKRPFFL